MPVLVVQLAVGWPCENVLCMFLLVLVHVGASLSHCGSTMLCLSLRKTILVFPRYSHHPSDIRRDKHVPSNSVCWSDLCQNIHLVNVGFGVSDHLYGLVLCIRLCQQNFSNASPVAMQISGR